MGNTKTMEIKSSPGEDPVIFDGLPDSRSFVTLTEFTEILGITRNVAKEYIRAGKIKAMQHPFNKLEKVIPIAEIRRAFMTSSEMIIPYPGRMYPHQFYIYFSMTNHGYDLDAVIDDLIEKDLIVPEEDELEAMHEAVFSTAPDIVKKRARKGWNYIYLESFEQWITRLGFSDIFDDIIGYVPAGVMQHNRIRYIIEIMSSAEFLTYEISDVIKQLTDIAVDQQIISNYLLMFFYIKQMLDSDWSKYLHDVGLYDTFEAKTRRECCDNKVAVLAHFNLHLQVNPVEEYWNSIWKAKYIFDQWAMSDDFEKQKAMSGQIRNIVMMDGLIRKHAQDTSENAAEIRRKRQLASGGVNPVNIPEKSMEDNDPTFEDLGIDSKDNNGTEAAG